jgi:5'-nucleotidase (lipoprotein e(P4) family)
MKKVTMLCLAIFAVLVLTGYQQKGTNDHLTMSVLWVQKAAETRALCYQAFNVARMMVDQNLGSAGELKKPAIIVDIDETLLDNSPYEARLIKTGESFPLGWQEWTGLAQARPLPGAVGFLRYCDSLGIAIFYVSNRRVAEQAATMKNLEKTGFPQISEDHFYLRTGESSKEKRRQEIREKYNILLLVGDNLNDFADVFEKKPVEERFAETDKNREEFGTRFIVLPNPMYGDWEGALYNYDYRRSGEEKDDIRKNALVTY